MRALIGAALLAAGRPLHLRELAELLGLRPAEVPEQLREFEQALQAADLGFSLEEVAGGYRLVVLPETARQLAPVLAPPPLPPLSAAALEVLAVIAYRQPLTRAEVEAMRGASAGTIVTLQERELVKVLGRSEAVGRPLLYGTTEKFLLEFGLTALSDLPALEQVEGFHQLLRG